MKCIIMILLIRDFYYDCYFRCGIIRQRYNLNRLTGFLSVYCHSRLNEGCDFNKFGNL